MNRLLYILIVVLMSLTSAHAQEWGTKDVPKRLDWWLGASVGVTHSLAENATSTDFIHNYPGVDMQVGTFFSRALGMRLSMGLNPQLGRPGKAQREGDPETYDKNYRFMVLTGYLDALVDLTTLFTPRKKYRPSFDMLLYAGAGGLESFHFSRQVLEWTYYPVDTWDKTCWAAHAGLMASYRLSPHWEWTLEGSYNITTSDYDGVEGKVYLSGYVKLHSGFIYHFYEPGNSRVRLSTEDTSGWEPSYTYQDRAKAKKLQHKKLEQARKETAKRRAQHNKEIQRKNREAQKANRAAAKSKQKRVEAKEMAKRYNEI